jgi:acylphosphatase
VWFRGSARELARRLGVRGWARNRADGTVEALAQGERAAVEEWVGWCHQGPPGARVTGVERFDEAVGADPGEFAVR